MALTDEDTGSGTPEAVGGTSDEDTGHPIIVPPGVLGPNGGAPGQSDTSAPSAAAQPVTARVLSAI
jgi:hypothetical protein